MERVGCGTSPKGCYLGLHACGINTLYLKPKSINSYTSDFACPPPLSPVPSVHTPIVSSDLAMQWMPKFGLGECTSCFPHIPDTYSKPLRRALASLELKYLCGKVLGQEHKLEMLRYLHNHQNEDGGFGLHIEGHSTMFGTALR